MLLLSLVIPVKLHCNNPYYNPYYIFVNFNYAKGGFVLMHLGVEFADSRTIPPTLTECIIT